MAHNTDAVALYWDFENLHAAVADDLFGNGYYQLNRYRPQDPLVDVAAIIEYALSLGPIAINRAFGNWLSFNRYKQSLLQSAIELIQVFPPGANGKNGADIKLCLDVVDDMARFGHIGTVIVVGGDSDYMPLSYKVKAQGRSLIGIGSLRSTNQHWARSCHEFKFYEALVAPAAAAPVLADTATPATAPEAVPPAPSAEASAPAELVLATPSSPPADAAAALSPAMVACDAVQPVAETPAAPPAVDPAQAARLLVSRALARMHQSRGEAWVRKALLRPYIQRMDSTFQEALLGFGNFSDMLAAMPDLVEVRRGEFDHELRLRQPEEAMAD